MSDSTVMVQAFAELRYGVVVHMRENSVKYGHNFNQTLYERSTKDLKVHGTFGTPSAGTCYLNVPNTAPPPLGLGLGLGLGLAIPPPLRCPPTSPPWGAPRGSAGAPVS